MVSLSKKVQSLLPSATLTMAQKSGEMRAAGFDIVNFSVGEPDFNTPLYVKEAAYAAIEGNFTRYTPTDGYPSLKKAICDKLLRENGLEYSPSEICCSTGSKQSLCNALMALVDPGDEVILPTPCWGSYKQMVILAGGTPVEVLSGIEDDFKLTPSKLRAALTPRTKAIMLCSPSNPTGAVYSRSELEALVEVLLEWPRVFVISDEVYEHLDYSGKFVSMGVFGSIRDRLIITNGVSKAYAMTGWRLGYMAGPQEVAAACKKIQDQSTSCPSSVAQKAAEAALNGGLGEIEAMRRSYIERRELAVGLLSKIPGLKVTMPDGAFYVFIECSSYFGRKWVGADGLEHVICSGDDLSFYLLEKARVATVGGNFFGAPSYFRISYSVGNEDIRRGIESIHKALLEL